MFMTDGQHRVGRREIRHAQRDRAEAADLMLGRHRASGPTAVASPIPPSSTRREALAFRVFEVERQPAVALDRSRRSQAVVAAAGRFHQREARRLGDAQAPCATIACVPRRSRRRRPVEEGEVGARRGLAVGIEQVIGADVVLVHGLLDQPHAERPGCRSADCRARRRKWRSDGGCRSAAWHASHFAGTM